MKQIILSIDPGFKNCGFVISSYDDVDKSLHIISQGTVEVLATVTRNAQDYYYGVLDFYKKILGFVKQIDCILIENVYTPWMINRSDTTNVDFVFRLGLLVATFFSLGCHVTGGMATVYLMEPSVIKRKLKIKGKYEAIQYAKKQFKDAEVANKMVPTHHVADAINQTIYYLDKNHQEWNVLF